MRLLYVADGRSPIALNWIRYFVSRDDQVHLVSTFPCRPDLALDSLNILPLGLPNLISGERKEDAQMRESLIRRIIPVGLRTAIRQWVVPMTLPSAAQKLSEIISQVQPDLVHAMRIPFEGMLASLANPNAPLVISVWGNDFTLHASATQCLASHTRRTLQRTDALHTDCQRDMRLAHAWGFSADRAGIVVPGNGGVHLDIFSQGSFAESPEVCGAFDELWVIQPRGFRAYVCNHAFFQAIPLVLKHMPNVRFVCPAMAGEAQAEKWSTLYGVENRVELLPRQSRPQMAQLFQNSAIAVSPTTHDGTPNTLLEAMACGCLPVAGDIESVREWITPGVNGLLFDPTDSQSIADAILHGLAEPEFRTRAAEHNRKLVSERANYPVVMQEAARFYEKLIG